MPRVNVGDGERFCERLLLPWRFLRWWIAYNAIMTIGLVGMLLAFSLSAGERVRLGAAVAAVLVFLWVGALWYVGSTVRVRGGWLIRRLGHKRTRVAVTDIVGARATATDGPATWTPWTMVVSVSDGTTLEISTRRPEALQTALATQQPGSSTTQ